MSVTAEIVQNPSEQDVKDLSRIYETPENELPAWLEKAIDGDSLVFAGRFNDRLLGAFCLRPESGSTYRLEQLQVRNITRRRGVARQLLQLALRELPPEVKRIDVDLGEYPHLEDLFAEVGFSAGDDGRYQWKAAS